MTPPYKTSLAIVRPQTEDAPAFFKDSAQLLIVAPVVATSSISKILCLFIVPSWHWNAPAMFRRL
jgi:hypothetical protein